MESTQKVEEVPKVEEEKKDYADIIFNYDDENKKCVDCGAENPTMASINNGVTICETCSKSHTSLGYAISYLRPLNAEWDDYLLYFMEVGGNSQFKKQIEKLGLNPKFPIDMKYKSCAVDYYRRNLKAKVTNTKESEVDYKDPNETMINPANSFPEFENYELGSIKVEKSTGMKIKGFFGKVGQSFKRAGTKIENSKATETLKKGGQKTVEGLKKAGTFVAGTTAPVTSKIKIGAKVVGMKMKSFFGGLFSNGQ